MFKSMREGRLDKVTYILRRVMFSLRSMVAIYPAYSFFYQPFIWWNQLKRKSNGKNPSGAIIRTDTELVIDGFQGSANSFATEAFQYSQTKPVILAHHLHSPSQIIQAVNLDIPVLLTIREPMAAVISLTSRWSYVSVTQGLKSYIAFYSELKPYRSQLVVSDFIQTTKHLDTIIDGVNQKFNCDFTLINVEEINNKYKLKSTHKTSDNSSRNETKQQKKAEFETQKNIILLEKANQVYQDFKMFIN